MAIPVQGMCSDGDFPALYCFVDLDGQVTECHDTLFEIDTVYRCGGSGDRFNGTGPGVLRMGYTFEGTFFEVAAWSFIGYGYNSPPDDVTFVFASERLAESGFEIWRWWRTCELL